MKKLALILVLTLTSCQSDNSNTFDALLGSINIDPANVNLVKAYPIINNKCINCHSGYHNSWAGLNTDAKWVADGSVVSGSLGDSTLITKLKNRGGNMPLNAPQLTDDEYDALATWIENM